MTELRKAAQQAFDTYVQARDGYRGDEFAEVDAAMVGLREALAATEPHDHRVCPICQAAIARAEASEFVSAEDVEAMRDGRLVYAHGQALSREQYPGLHDALKGPEG